MRPIKLHPVRDFIKRAKTLFGNKYSYILCTKDFRCTEKLPIICNSHGVFYQKASEHLKGRSCMLCRNADISKTQTKTTAEFITHAKKVHGNKYVYTKTAYINSESPVIITCKKHGDFKQIPSSHLRKGGCILCGRIVAKAKAISTMRLNGEKEFIIQSKIIYKNKFLYPNVNYTTALCSATVTCKKHGDFRINATKHLSGNTVCPKCRSKELSKTNPKIKAETTEEFIIISTKIHGKLYDYSKVKYLGPRKKVIIRCKKHGEFKQVPFYHMKGKICPECKSIARLNKLKKYSTEEFISQAVLFHKDAYSYTNCTYVNSFTRVNVECKVHGPFTVNPRSHLKGTGCPDCKSTRYSKISLRWIKEYAKSHRLKDVRHAGNGGEYHVPGTKYRVDGYHARTNTILEFHGDIFHGNPKIFKPKDRLHPFNDKTAKELYKETIVREKILRSLGYKLIVMWESDYRSSKSIRNQ